MDGTSHKPKLIDQRNQKGETPKPEERGEKEKMGEPPKVVEGIPKLSRKMRAKLRGIHSDTLANIYLQPEGLPDLMGKLFPEFDWVPDSTLYPKDWILSPNKKSIFQRKFFHMPAILNPPYAEVPQRSSPRAKDEKPLKFHIAHILQVARASQIPMAILLPVREGKSWFKKLKKQPDVTCVFLANELTFKNIEGEYMPPAKFKSFIAVVGFHKSDLKVKNNKRGFLL